MATTMKRLSVTLLPEWEKDLTKLKKEEFYNKTQSDLIRYLIKLGLETSKKQQIDKSVSEH